MVAAILLCDVRCLRLVVLPHLVQRLSVNMDESLVYLGSVLRSNVLLGILRWHQFALIIKVSKLSLAHHCIIDI